MTKEVRLKEVRAIEDSENMIVEGYAIVFDEPTDLGGYIEVIERSALDGCDMTDICMKYNHEDTYLIMARTRNNSLTFNIDEKGLKIRAELIDTQANKDVYKAIRAGLLDKMSFAFVINECLWEIEDGEKDIRRITSIAKLFDVSVVDVPAYSQTEIYARSKEAVEKEQEQFHKLKLEKEKLKLLLNL